MDAVAWAYENGIVNGTSLTTFSPDEDVTREQMAAILFRYSNYMNYDTSNKGNLGTFTDADAVSDYVLIPMKWAHCERLLREPTRASSHSEMPPEPKQQRYPCDSASRSYLKNKTQKGGSSPHRNMDGEPSEIFMKYAFNKRHKGRKCHEK